MVRMTTRSQRRTTMRRVPRLMPRRIKATTTVRAQRTMLTGPRVMMVRAQASFLGPRATMWSTLRPRRMSRRSW